MKIVSSLLFVSLVLSATFVLAQQNQSTVAAAPANPDTSASKASVVTESSAAATGYDSDQMGTTASTSDTMKTRKHHTRPAFPGESWENGSGDPDAVQNYIEYGGGGL